MRDMVIYRVSRMNFNMILDRGEEVILINSRMRNIYQ